MRPQTSEIWINKLDREEVTITSVGTRTVTFDVNIENTLRKGIWLSLDNFLELYEPVGNSQIMVLENALKEMREIF